jgi:transcription elongation factor Elf1
MSEWIAERPVSCPFCGERIEIAIDLSAGGQEYTEDCQVCCQPMLVSYAVEDDQLMSLQVTRGN